MYFVIGVIIILLRLSWEHEQKKIALEGANRPVKKAV